MLAVRPWQNLYIHVPFCSRKCGYCAFYSEAGKESQMRPWLDKIESELTVLRGRSIHTVYIGGGDADPFA